MSCGAIAFLSRIKWWLFGPKTKLCRRCCICCKYYDECKWDVDYVEEVFGEPFE